MTCNTRSTLYVGYTNNLRRRCIEHKSKELEGFTKSFNCVNLVYFEFHNNKEQAKQRENQLKKWKRKWKEDLIESENPDWKDLAVDWD